MTVAQWAEKYRYISAENSALPGKYSLAITPYLRGILECINDRGVRKVVCQKSAQVGWTDGVINNLIGYLIHIAPAPAIVMFPRDQNAKDYNVEKFNPMVEATPVLAALVETKTRTADNTQNRKKFPGGFLKFIGSNSTGGVKSTPAKIMIVEEPDDCNLNIKGQGDSIKLLEERGKTYHDSKVVAGGTPSIKGVSSIAAELLASDQRKNFVPCHECGESHVLAWENVHWQSDETRTHAIYGKALPESAYYVCPHCAVIWNDAQKNRAVRNGVWKATAEFRGVAGFYLNELYSPFAESKLSRLVEKYLAAQLEADQGDIGALIAFWNSSLGLPWEYQSDIPSEDDLKDRAEEYDEFTIPWGGLVLTAGVDVQHDRLAVVIRAWGRGEESWLVYWGELYGDTKVPEKGAWVDLDALLTREFIHASGTTLRIRAVSIDSSDGATSDPVYSYVRKRLKLKYMAVKGASTDDAREIFATPRASVDTNRQHKSNKHGLKPFIVGTTRAKDLILDGRLQLAGTGPGRMHWYRSVRPDYWEQLVSEVKVPHRTIKRKKVWTAKAGVRNEALDCEVYALHATRSLKTNLFKESAWLNLESQLQKPETIKPETRAIEADKPVIKPKPAPFNPGKKGYSASRW
ncbi:Phage terminase, large subunit GpA [Nitrosospira sp. Nsp11]|nr:Phage terminase, large subunit GpA [Nitrosospira sp. Nsp11]